jgi:hypothetical protein
MITGTGVHDRPESAFTIDWNECSRSTGIGVHDPPERATGKVWKYTGTPCSGNSCPGWQMLDDNGSTGRIAASDTALYQIHEPRTALTRTRTCYDCR